MKILVAVDGSRYTRRMLAYLAAHDEWLGSHHQYTVVHAVASLPPRATAALEREMVKGYYDDTAEQVFKPIRSFFAKQGLNAEFVPKVGNAADTIVKMANKGKPDLVVLGSHGHGTLGKLIMGSVATRVIADCGVPVLLIR